jgi:hypothetical protein
MLPQCRFECLNLPNKQRRYGQMQIHIEELETVVAPSERFWGLMFGGSVTGIGVVLLLISIGC